MDYSSKTQNLADIAQNQDKQKGAYLFANDLTVVIKSLHTYH